MNAPWMKTFRIDLYLPRFASILRTNSNMSEADNSKCDIIKGFLDFL